MPIFRRLRRPAANLRRPAVNLRRFRRPAAERLEQRQLLAVGIIELGPSDNIALDQPRAAVELLADVDPGPGQQWESVGPSVFNTFLLDTGANSVLAMATAVNDLDPDLYATQGEFVEVGVAGVHELDISVPYRFDFAGTSGIRHTLDDARILSDPDNDFSMFGPWGLVGMPAMVGRVTSLDMTGWSGGGLGLDDLYMKTEFADDVPAEPTPPGTSHRYAVPVDNRLAFDPLDQVVYGDPPVWGDVPFLTAIPTHNAVGQAGNFLFDTGAQISVISEHLALDIGLDSNGDGQLDELDDSFVTTETVGGVGGQVTAPVFAIDEVHLPATRVASGEEVELVWTDLQWLVLDIATPPDQPRLDGVFGSDLITSGWFYAFFSPGSPDGYIDRMHFDFRDMANGTGTIYFDLNAGVDQVTVPGPGVRIRQTARSTDVGEGGETDTYTIALQTVPAAPVQITINADAQTQISTDGTTFAALRTLTFTDTTPQTITVRAVDDDVAEGSHTSLLAHAVTSADGNYHQLAVPDLTVNVTDNDLQLLTITADAAGTHPLDAISVAEGGPTVNYWVALKDPPPSDMWVVIEDLAGQTTPRNPNNSTGDPLFDNVLIFTPSDWNQPQLVELAAVDDALPEGPHEARLIHTLLDLANFLDPILGQSVLPVSIADNDRGDVTITPTGDGTSLTEAGATDTYQIALTMPPAGPVEITVTADPQTQVSGDGGGTFAATLALTFTDTAPQTVTVRAVDDAQHEGPHTGTITHAVTGTVADPKYPATLALPSVTATIADNDTAGLALTETDGATTVTEGAAADTYAVVLTSQPTGDVTLFLNHTAGQITVVDNAHPANAFLTFTPANWNTPQEVLVTAVDDTVVEGPHTAAITHAAFSSDPNYQGTVFLAVAVTDNDTPALTVAIAAAAVAENAGAAATTVTVTRNTPTDAALEVTLASSDPSTATVPSPVMIPAGAAAVTVDLAAVDDTLADGTQTVTITASAAGFTAGSDTVQVTDDDADVDGDGDGVPGGIEAGAPNNGDGNADGIPDAAQVHVTSLPNVVDGSYVTLVVPAGQSLVDVRAVANPSAEDAPPDTTFPIGCFEYAVTDVGVGQATTVRLYWASGATLNAYLKYGPTPDNPTSHWYPFMDDGTTGARIYADHLEIRLVDGLRGDDDLTANGTIVDPAAPAARLHPWQNPVLREDVDNNGLASALDVLRVITEINTNDARDLPRMPDPGTTLPPFWDVSGDDYLAAVDVLMIIDYLNTQAETEQSSGGGEQAGLADSLAAAPEGAALPRPAVWWATPSGRYQEPQTTRPASPPLPLEPARVDQVFAVVAGRENRLPWRADQLASQPLRTARSKLAVAVEEDVWAEFWARDLDAAQTPSRSPGR